jgi:DNA modification methylase
MLDEQTGILTSGARTGKRNKPKTKNAYGKFKLADEAPSEESSGAASRFFYVAKASTSERNAGLEEKNPHPTVKPINLNKWLAGLLLPPDSVQNRRILVPFSGSGSEMIGAMLAGWDEVVGVEMNPEYCEIAKARLEHWKSE